MDAQLKELAKLEKLASNAPSAKGKTPCYQDSLDTLLHSLKEVKERLQSGTASQDTFTNLSSKVDAIRKDVDDRQKEIHGSLTRLNKAMEKVRLHVRMPAISHGLACIIQKFSGSLPTYQPLFTSPEAVSALESAIAVHFLRTGQFTTAETFINVSQYSTFARSLGIREHVLCRQLCL